jgi:hypothetical protein
MKSYRVNSRKNPWRNTRDIKSVDPAKVWGILLTVFMPIMIITIALNVTMRLPDSYDFNMSSSEILDTMTTQIDQQTLSNLFGDYMQHRTDVFQMKQNTSYNPQNVFNAADQKFMYNIRHSLDMTAAIAILAVIITGLAMFFLIRWRKHEIHMKAFKRGAVIFFILTALNTAVKLITPLFDKLIDPIRGTGFVEGDPLITILSAGFTKTETMFELLISCVFLGVLAYVTWQVAGPKRLFKGY